MTQIQLPVEVTVRQEEKLTIAVAKELNLEDNKELFQQLIKASGVCSK